MLYETIPVGPISRSPNGDKKKERSKHCLFLGIILEDNNGKIIAISDSFHRILYIYVLFLKRPRHQLSINESELMLN